MRCTVDTTDLSHLQASKGPQEGSDSLPKICSHCRPSTKPASNKICSEFFNRLSCISKTEKHVFALRIFNSLRSNYRVGISESPLRRRFRACATYLSQVGHLCPLTEKKTSPSAV